MYVRTCRCVHRLHVVIFCISPLEVSALRKAFRAPFSLSSDRCSFSRFANAKTRIEMTRAANNEWATMATGKPYVRYVRDVVGCVTRQWEAREDGDDFNKT